MCKATCDQLYRVTGTHYERLSPLQKVLLDSAVPGTKPSPSADCSPPLQSPSLLQLTFRSVFSSHTHVNIDVICSWTCTKTARSLYMACTNILWIALYHFQRSGSLISWPSQLQGKAASAGWLPAPHNRKMRPRSFCQLSRTTVPTIQRPGHTVVFYAQVSQTFHSSVSSWAESDWTTT